MSIDADPTTGVEPEEEDSAYVPISGGPMGRMVAPGMPLERSKDFRGTLRRLGARLTPEIFRVIGVVILALAGVVLAAFGPLVLGDATNVIVRGLEHGGPHAINFGSLHHLLLVVVLLYIGSATFQYLAAYTLAGMVQRTMYRLRADVEDKLNRVPLGYVDRSARGDLLSRVTNDIDNLAQSLQQTIGQAMTNIFMLIGTMVMMFVISPLLAVVAVVSIPLSATLIKFIAQRSKIRFMAQWRNTGRLNALVEESLTGHAVVKTFGRQREVEETFRETNDELYQASYGAQSISGTIQPLMVMVGNLNYVAIAVIGGVRVASKALTIGGVQAFIQYSRQFAQPLQMLASMANLFQSGLASAERVFEFLDAPEQSAEEPHVTTAPSDENPWTRRVRARVVLLRSQAALDHGPLAGGGTRTDGSHRRTHGSG